MIFFPLDKFSKRFGDQFFSFLIVGYSENLPEENESCFSMIPDAFSICKLPVIYYHIKVFRGSQEPWICKRRFSEFLRLGEEISKSYYPEESKEIIMPSKSFLRNNGEEFLTARQMELTEYMEKLCVLSKEVDNIPPLCNFFELEIQNSEQ